MHRTQIPGILIKAKREGWSHVFFLMNHVTTIVSRMIIDAYDIDEGGSNGDGGGIKVVNSQISISNCIIKNNHASKRGGGIFSSASHIILQSLTINNNSAGEWTNSETCIE